LCKWQAGTRVELIGLASNVELNGQRGEVTGWNKAKQRVTLRLESGRLCSVRFVCIRTLDSNDEARSSTLSQSPAAEVEPPAPPPAEPIPPLKEIFRPGMRFRGDIRIPGIRDDASPDEREQYSMDIVAHEPIFAGVGAENESDKDNIAVLCWHQAYQDSQICPLVLASARDTRADDGGLVVRWADAETQCTGTIQDVTTMMINGSVAQLVHGEDGFLHASDAVTHTFSLCAEPFSAAAVEASVCRQTHSLAYY